MAKPTRSRSERGKAAGMALRALAFVWLAPALAINLDWTPAGRVDWNIGAAFCVAAVAVIVESLRHIRGRMWFALALMLGCALFLANIANGFRNAVTRSGDSSDLARGEIEAAKLAEDLRERLLKGRLVAAKIASEEPPASYRAMIEQAKASDARRWLATGGCNPSGGVKGGITAPESQAFCANIQTLTRKLGAAERREQIDNQLAVLDLRRDGTAPPASADPFADKVAEVVPIAPSSIRLFFDALWALLPEVVAAVMPALTLWLLDHPKQLNHNAHPGPSRPVVQTRSPPDHREPFAEFVTQMLEPAHGARLSPAEAMRLWQSFCITRGIAPKSQRWLGLRLGRAFQVEERHKRKSYLNVRPRVTVVRP